MVPADRDQQQAPRFRPAQPAAGPAAPVPTRDPEACPGDEDVDLLRGIAMGDQGCFERFYDRYNPIIYAICLRILQNHMDAEEALIETFWQIWRQADRYDETQGTVRGFLFMIARSRALDRRRSRSAGVQSSHIEDVQKYGGGPQAPDGNPGSPVADTLDSERRARTREAMESLTPEQREAIELAFFDGLSHSQVAEALSQPLGTVKTRIRQGLIRMRDALRSAYGGDAT